MALHLLTRRAAEAVPTAAPRLLASWEEEGSRKKTVLGVVGPDSTTALEVSLRLNEPVEKSEADVGRGLLVGRDVGQTHLLALCLALLLDEAGEGKMLLGADDGNLVVPLEDVIVDVALAIFKPSVGVKADAAIVLLTELFKTPGLTAILKPAVESQRAEGDLEMKVLVGVPLVEEGVQEAVAGLVGEGEGLGSHLELRSCYLGCWCYPFKRVAAVQVFLEVCS